MKDTIDKIINEAKLFYCVECGKCVAGCPLAEIYKDFSYEVSARGIIRKALLGFNIVESKDIWFCLNCDLCADMCPTGVKYAQFIENVRLLAIGEGLVENCSFCERCSQYYLPVPTLDNLKGTLMGKLPDELVNLCPNCRRREAASMGYELRRAQKEGIGPEVGHPGDYWPGGYKAWHPKTPG
ncbi:4Fe-4S dicluster domain-containing protein [Chloroflexota bacterium]